MDEQQLSLEEQQQIKNKGIKVMGLIAVLGIICFYIIESSVNDPESPTGNVSQKMLSMNACYDKSMTLGELIDTNFTDYKLHQSVIYRTDEERVKGGGIVTISVTGRMRYMGRETKNAELTLIADGLFSSEDFAEIVVSSATLDNERITDKSKLVDIKRMLCGEKTGSLI